MCSEMAKSDVAYRTTFTRDSPMPMVFRGPSRQSCHLLEPMPMLAITNSPCIGVDVCSSSRFLASLSLWPLQKRVPQNNNSQRLKAKLLPMQHQLKQLEAGQQPTHGFQAWMLLGSGNCDYLAMYWRRRQVTLGTRLLSPLRCRCTFSSSARKLNQVNKVGVAQLHERQMPLPLAQF